MTSMRLDQSVLSLGLAKDISHAHGLILAGEILVNNQIQDKVGVSVSIDAEIRLKQEKIPFVSRGASNWIAPLDIGTFRYMNRFAWT